MIFHFLNLDLNILPFSNQNGLGTQSWCAPFCLIDSSAAGGCVPAWAETSGGEEGEWVAQQPGSVAKVCCQSSPRTARWRGVCWMEHQTASSPWQQTTTAAHSKWLGTAIPQSFTAQPSRLQCIPPVVKVEECTVGSDWYDGANGMLHFKGGWNPPRFQAGHPIHVEITNMGQH